MTGFAPRAASRRSCFFGRCSLVANWPRLVLPALLVAAISISGCTSIERYRTEMPDTSIETCSKGGNPDGCNLKSTERHTSFTMHVVEFDDEGWPFDPTRVSAEQALTQTQLDSAIAQIRGELANPNHCVKLFVYVHGWQHNAAGDDDDVKNFRDFLRSAASRKSSTANAGSSACTTPIQATEAKEATFGSAAKADGNVRMVGLFVGWRGRSVEGSPFKYSSFWDRKNTAERVAQGSVRELFGRLAAVVDANRPAAAGLDKPPSRLRVYVIGHSFGASVVFRAISQTLVDSFAAGLDDPTPNAAASISRSLDMVVLVNPAIEAARFDPVFRAASKRAALCPQPAGCTQPPYQAPVLAIFTSEGDWATKYAFPVGTTLGNLFEKAVTPEQARAIHKTIGWDADYVTHELKVDSTCTSAANRDPFEGPPSSRRYRAPGWTWCFEDENTGTLALTHVPSIDGKSSGTTTYNGPLWNVRVSSEIIENHNDIWNARFRGVLLHFFADSATNAVVLQTLDVTAASN